MKDKQFLEWVAECLVHVYGESPNVDFVLKLKSIARATPEGQVTPNTYPPKETKDQ